MGQIEITPEIKIDESDFVWEFVRATGPGGQNVNKVATAVKLRLNLDKCDHIPSDMRLRLVRMAGRKIAAGNMLLIDARRFRTQERNRRDAVERMVELLKKAAWTPKKRRRTRPSKAQQERIKAHKRYRSAIKKLRRPILRDDQ